MVEIMTVKEVARVIRASQSFIYKRYKEFGGIKIAGIIRFNKLDFENRIGEKFADNQGEKK